MDILISIKMISSKLWVALLLVSAYALTEYKVTIQEKGTSYLRLGLKYTGTDEYYIKEKSKIIKDLQFELQCYTFLDFSFKIYDPKNKRY